MTVTDDQIVTFKGMELTLEKPPLQVGEKVRPFIAVDQEMQEWPSSHLAGKPAVICTVPSLDTAVCEVMTRQFNEEIARFGSQLGAVTISMDLPFAQARWCGAQGIDHMQVVSDYRTASAAAALGVLIHEWRLLARAVFVLDDSGKVHYMQLVREVTDQPDHDAALQAIERLVGS